MGKEIITGLKFETHLYKSGIPVDKMKHMMGSYGPKAEVQSFTSAMDEAPKGMLARGSYTCKSKFVDDDKKEYFTWEWTLKIVKKD